MCIKIDFQGLLERFLTEAEENGISLPVKLVGQGEDENGMYITLADIDATDIRVEFEDWVQREVWKEIEQAETVMDWETAFKRLKDGGLC